MKDLLQIYFFVISLGAIFVAWWYRFFLAPKIKLELSHRWMGGNPGIGILTIKATNTSNVRIRKNSLRLQVLFYSVARMKNLGEWVPFKNDYSSEWSAPQKICTTTKYVYPGDTITVDHPILFPENQCVGHVGLQFRTKLSLLQSILFNYWPKRKEQWTTTIFVWPEHQQDCQKSSLGGAASEVKK